MSHNERSHEVEVARYANDSHIGLVARNVANLSPAVSGSDKCHRVVMVFNGWGKCKKKNLHVGVASSVTGTTTLATRLWRKRLVSSGKKRQCHSGRRGQTHAKNVAEIELQSQCC